MQQKATKTCIQLCNAGMQKWHGRPFDMRNTDNQHAIGGWQGQYCCNAGGLVSFDPAFLQPRKKGPAGDPFGPSL